MQCCLYLFREDEAVSLEYATLSRCLNAGPVMLTQSFLAVATLERCRETLNPYANLDGVLQRIADFKSIPGVLDAFSAWGMFIECRVEVNLQDSE